MKVSFDLRELDPKKGDSILLAPKERPIKHKTTIMAGGGNNGAPPQIMFFDRFLDHKEVKYDRHQKLYLSKEDVAFKIERGFSFMHFDNIRDLEIPHLSPIGFVNYDRSLFSNHRNNYGHNILEDNQEWTYVLDNPEKSIPDIMEGDPLDKYWSRYHGFVKGKSDIEEMMRSTGHDKFYKYIEPIL
jgi:hypothetical protein